MVQTHSKLFIKNPIHIGNIKSPILISNIKSPIFIDNIKNSILISNILQTQFSLTIYQKPNFH